MGILGRDEILAKTTLNRELVDVPELGEDAQVWVRGLTAFERDEYEQSLLRAKGSGRRQQLVPAFMNAKARLCVKCVVDEAGNRVFSDRDADALGKTPAAALDRIVQVAHRLSGMSIEDLEDLTGNSLSAQGEDSPSS